MTAKNGTLYIRSIPDNVKRDFKIACLRRGISMTQAILTAMLDTIEEDRIDEARKSTQG